MPPKSRVSSISIPAARNFAIFINVRPGFEISPYIEPKETFFALREVLLQG